MFEFMLQVLHWLIIAPVCMVNLLPALGFYKVTSCPLIVNRLVVICFLLQPGESLRDFYRRTSLYWQMAAHEHTQHTGKVCFIELFITICFKYTWKQ